jgi:hypothetical protein
VLVLISYVSQGREGISRFEVYQSKDNSKKYGDVGGPRKCGGVPFFYNSKTGVSICGSAVDCDKLKLWAEAEGNF